MRKAALRVTTLVSIGVLAQALCACSDIVYIAYGGDQADGEKIIPGCLTFLKEYMPVKVPAHLKDIEWKLIAPKPAQPNPPYSNSTTMSRNAVCRFKADCQMHLRNGVRIGPSATIVAELARSFPKQAEALADQNALEGEYRAPQDVNSELEWLIYNKKTDDYFLYLNSQPDPDDCTHKPVRLVIPKPW